MEYEKSRTNGRWNVMNLIVYSFILIFILLLTTNNQAQENKIKFEFLPAGLNFVPLKANIQEAKIGVLFFPDNKNLKVDMGNNSDLIKIKYFTRQYFSCFRD